MLSLHSFLFSKPRSGSIWVLKWKCVNVERIFLPFWHTHSLSHAHSHTLSHTHSRTSLLKMILIIYPRLFCSSQKKWELAHPLCKEHTHFHTHTHTHTQTHTFEGNLKINFGKKIFSLIKFEGKEKDEMMKWKQKWLNLAKKKITT